MLQGQIHSTVLRTASALGCLLLAFSGNAGERNVSVDEVGGRLAEVALELGRDLKTDMEQEFRDWDPTTEPTTVPPTCLRAPDASPIGTWQVVHDSLTRLYLWKRDDSRLGITFYTAGHLMNWLVRRTARQSGDVIQLDGPVREYFSSGTYSRLYLVEVEGLPYLLPSVYVECVQQVVDEVGCGNINRKNAGGCLLTRGP